MKADPEMSSAYSSGVHFNGEERKRMALIKTTGRLKTPLQGMQAGGFHPRHEGSSCSEIVNLEKCHQGKKPVLPLMVVICINSNGGIVSSGGSGSTGMTIMMRKG